DVPAGRALTVEARVNPADIAHLEEGQEAEIAVTAFNRRLDDTLRGRVIHVAPDTSTSPDGNDTWFNVRLAIEGQTGNGEARLSDVHAGMQAEVYINTGAQTFAGWMMKPVTDSFRRAFREK
ncbi:MAG: HlyD family efflux transporter periplasmic adaptor subunit, partial [Pseudomonadota bacterium]